MSTSGLRNASILITGVNGGMVVANEFQFVQTNAKSLEKTVYQNVLGEYLTVKYLEENNL